MVFNNFISTHKMFFVSLMVGTFIALWQFIENAFLWNNMAYGIPENAYISWIGGSLYFVHSNWFYLILPILSGMSVCIEYGILVKNNYYMQHKVRMTKKAFCLKTGGMIFSLGFMVIAVPLLLNFTLTMTVRPLLYPDPLIAVGPYANEIGAALFYKHPLIYTISYILFDGLFSGTTALFSCGIFHLVDSYILASVFPFAIYYCLFTLGGLFQTIVICPNVFLVPAMGLGSVWTVAGCIIYLIITLLVWVKCSTYMEW
ncbi:MAG: hypothetical protein HUJ71_08050 [Pseudobutyrivibrio sp.]|nr:hypothetical protein [Pseudobutyrivibrio sp.]